MKQGLDHLPLVGDTSNLYLHRISSHFLRTIIPMYHILDVPGQSLLVAFGNGGLVPVDSLVLLGILASASSLGRCNILTACDLGNFPESLAPIVVNDL